MSDTFNGYHVWLGIPAQEQPPNHYRLLGIAPFETDLDVIDHAADRQMAHVRTFQGGRHQSLSQQILNELSGARLCLLNPAKKSAYDEGLREQLKAAPVLMARPLPTAQPVRAGVPVTSAAPVTAAAPRAQAVRAESRGSAATISPAPARLVKDISVEEELLSLESRSTITLTAGAANLNKRMRRRGLSQAAWYRPALLGLLAAVAVTTFLALVFAVRWLSNNDWREHVDFSVFEPSAPASAPLVEGEQAEAPPAPPTAEPALPGSRPTL
jgi:hypothetical protein